MIVVLILTVLILAITLTAVLVIVCFGMRRERQRWLTNQPPTRTASAARSISGLYVRMPGRDTHVDDGTSRMSIPASRSNSFVA